MNQRGFWSSDFISSIVVFLVALPLCLGIALASGAPLFSGIIAGIIGGIVVGYLSGSSLSVSGPAAGLTTIVLSTINNLGSFEAFLLSLLLAGGLQLLFGYLKAGAIGNFFPSAVIKGMLAAIGLILILKQIPHAIGDDLDFEGDESFTQADGENTFTEIIHSLSQINPGVIIITLISFLIVFIWNSKKMQRYKVARLVPSALIVVVAGTTIKIILPSINPGYIIEDTHLVSVPAFFASGTFSEHFNFPDLTQIQNINVWFAALTIALVASLETLLGIEATDKMDPQHRITPLNQELKAQGVGNIISSLLGGLPMTSVVVRSTANIAAGASTKASTIMHGTLLLLSVLLIPFVLNQIPLSCLAVILITLGYKLTKPSIYKEMFSKGMSQFIPFVITILAIVFTDMLIGIIIGMLVGLYFILTSNFTDSILLVKDGNNYLLKLTRDVSFLNKKSLRDKLISIPEGSSVIIDGGSVQFIDADIIETFNDFIANAQIRNIQVELKLTNRALHPFFKK